MPTYEYKCDKDESHKYSEIRGITEDAKRLTCAEDGCDGKLIRVFSAPPITFNGTGFSAKHG
jgi:predicted nucleic acid-binding Zn ribbon protein